MLTLKRLSRAAFTLTSLQSSAPSSLRSRKYPRTGAPPVRAGALQLSTISDPVQSSRAMAEGAEGTSGGGPEAEETRAAAVRDGGERGEDRGGRPFLLSRAAEKRRRNSQRRALAECCLPSQMRSGGEIFSSYSGFVEMWLNGAEPRLQKRARGTR